MDKQNAIDTYNGILFSLKKEKSVTSYKMDEPWGHYAKWISQSQKVRYYWLLSWNIESNQIHRNRKNGTGVGENGSV